MKCLADTGCSENVLNSRLVKKLKGQPGFAFNKEPVKMQLLNGSICEIEGFAFATVTVLGKQERLRFAVMDITIMNYDCVLGWGTFSNLGGVHFTADGRVESETLEKNYEVGESFGCAASHFKDDVVVEDKDFVVKFDSSDRNWKLKWVWRNDKANHVLSKNTPKYGMSEEDEKDVDNELSEWLNEDWMEPYDAAVHGENGGGVVPLMAVFQESKNKSRPVLDFRDLNSMMESQPGADSAVCAETIRKFRRMGKNLFLVDLRKAYMQIHVDPECYKFQVIKWKGRKFVVKRMMFGMAAAPKVLRRVLEKIFNVTGIREFVEFYADDIAVDAEKIEAERVRSLLADFGLVTKEPVHVNGARVLGLKVQEEKGGALSWKRDNDTIGEFVLEDGLTRRQLYSMCGRLVSHFPVAAWLRVACSYLKRLTSEFEWDENLPVSVVSMCTDLLNRVKQNDPCRGHWRVESIGCNMWCDASSIALGVVMEVDGQVVEDNAWLRKKDDAAHVNVAELDAVLKGINLAIQWNMKMISVKSDSTSVVCWLDGVINNTQRVRTKGQSEMLIRRRLQVIQELIEEYELQLNIELVKSANNKADELTRVPKKWLRLSGDVNVSSGGAGVEINASTGEDKVREVHETVHFGFERTKEMCKLLGVDADPKLIKKVCASCEMCRSIDPAPVRVEAGTTKTEEIWRRISLDFTHYENRIYLTILDCGSGFTIWREASSESTRFIVHVLGQVFCEWGPPGEILCDNGPGFSSAQFQEFLSSWNVKLIHSCAYRPQGNAVERIHRTIKCYAARSGKKPEVCVFWYNRIGGSLQCPFDKLRAGMMKFYPHQIEDAEIANIEADMDYDQEFKIGDAVYVKPDKNVKCTTRWRKGVVTKTQNRRDVEVDGIKRHLSHVRKCGVHDDAAIAFPHDGFEASDETSDEEEAEDVEILDEEPLPLTPPRLRDRRNLRGPRRYSDSS